MSFEIFPEKLINLETSRLYNNNTVCAAYSVAQCPVIALPSVYRPLNLLCITCTKTVDGYYA